MTPLSHADAHERIADLALEPGGLDRLGANVGDPLAAHAAACETCGREVGAWRATRATLDVAQGVGANRIRLADLAADAPIRLPDGLRESVRAAIGDHSAGERGSVPPIPDTPDVANRPASLTARARLGVVRRLLPIAAVLAIVAVGTGIFVDQGGRLEVGRRDVAGLRALAVTMDRILRDPDHRVVSLRGADGLAAGTIAWSSRDIAMLTLALAPPPPDRVYRCWIERAGVRSPVGQMWFSGTTAYWNGSLDEWATTSFGAGGTFGISLEPISGSVGSPAILAADLGG